MSSYKELDKTVAFLRKRNVEFSILQCTTAYPTSPAEYGLNVMKELKERYKVPVGYSDHSAKKETCIAATALGAEILEFHAVFSRNDSGPDATSSLEIAEIKEMVNAVRNIVKALKNPVNKSDSSAFTELKNIFEKSLAVNKNLQKGQVLTFEDLESKKPKGYGINASEFEDVLGKKLKRDLPQSSFLKKEDVDF